MRETVQFVFSGLDFDRHQQLLSESEITYLLNGDITDFSQSSTAGFVQNIRSNKLCYKVPKYGEIKGVTKLNNDEYIIALKFPNTSKFILFDAKTCSSIEVFEAPCLDFTDEVKMVYKIYNCDRRVYFIEKCKPLKFFDIKDCPSNKRLSECNICPQTYSQEVDCDSLLVDKPISFNCPELSEVNGNIPNGVYQVAIAFGDNNQRVTEYFIQPQLLKIFNKKGTSGISIDFGCIDTAFEQYELVLIAHRSDRATSAQSIGWFDTSSTTNYISNLDETFYTPIDLETLFLPKTYIKGANRLVSNSESLVIGDVTEYIIPDYRFEASQITTEVVMISVKASEAHKYPSLMRGEVYPVEIEWFANSGRTLGCTHIPSSSPTLFDLPVGENGELTDTRTWTKDQLAPDNLDRPKNNNCEETEYKIWEVYNTSKEIEAQTQSCKDCDFIEVASFTPSYWESKDHKYDQDHPNVDLRCQGVRYTKMPENCLAPLTSTTTDCGEPCVNILTIRLKNVQSPKDCNGNLVPNVAGYRIRIGDRTNHKSVLHKGILFNTGNDTINCDTNSLYPNYPFNDVSPDPYLHSSLIRDGKDTRDGSPLSSFNHDKFTYHSPDIHYIQGQEGTQVRIYAEACGKVQGKFHYTEGYPEYQKLSRFGKLTAQAVGILEANLALNGEKCTTTEITEICKRAATRVTTIEDFPVAQYTQEAVSGGTTGLGGLSTTIFPGVSPGPTWTGGPIVHNGFSGGDGSSTIEKAPEPFTETTIGDPPCDGTPECEEWMNNPANEGVECIPDYTVGFEYVNCPDGSSTSSNGDNERCCVKFTVFDPVSSTNVQGVSVQITLVSQKYQGITDAEGVVIIEIDNDECGTIEFSKDTNTELFPKCSSCGDTETRTTTTTQECETTIDFIEDKEWFERLPLLWFYYQQGVDSATTLLQGTMTPKKYAVQYTAEACYDQFKCDKVRPGFIQRDIEHSEFLLPIKQHLGNGDRINNWSRESSLFLELCGDLDPLEDNTRKLYSEIFCNNDSPTGSENCGECTNEFGYCTEDNEDQVIKAESYYVGVTRYRPNQYGSPDNVRSKTKSCLQTDTTSEVVLAGDVYLSKMSVTRKMPLWDRLPLGLPLNSPFEQHLYPNVAQPTYWLDCTQESYIETLAESIPLISNFFDDHNLEDVVNLCRCCTGLDLGVDGLGEILEAGGVIAGIIAILALTDDDPLTLNPLDPDNLLGEIASAFGGGLGGALTAGITAAGTLGALIQWIKRALDGCPTNPFQQQGQFYTHVTGIANFWVESEFNSAFRDCTEQESTQAYPLRSLEEVAEAQEYNVPEQFIYDLSYLHNGIDKDCVRCDKELCCKEECDNDCRQTNRLYYSVSTDENSTADNWQNFPPLNFQQFSTQDGELCTILEMDDNNLFLGFEQAVYTTAYDSLTTNEGNEVFIGSQNAFTRRLRKVMGDHNNMGGVLKGSAINTPHGVFFLSTNNRFYLYNGQLKDYTNGMASWFKYHLRCKTGTQKASDIIVGYDQCNDNIYITDKEYGCTLHFKPSAEKWVSFHSWVPTNYYQMNNNLLMQNEEGLWKFDKEGYQTMFGNKVPFEVGFRVGGSHSLLQDLVIYTEFYKNKGFDCKVWENKFFDEILLRGQCGVGKHKLYIKDPNNIEHVTNKEVPSVTNVNKFEYRINNLNYTNTQTQPFYCLDENGCSYTIREGGECVPVREDITHIHLISHDTEYKKLVKFSTQLLDPNIK